MRLIGGSRGQADDFGEPLAVEAWIFNDALDRVRVGARSGRRNRSCRTSTVKVGDSAIQRKISSSRKATYHAARRQSAVGPPVGVEAGHDRDLPPS